MRALTNMLAALAVIGLGYWAYSQTVRTQAAVDEIAETEAAIRAARERLAVLNAEWAYLNRPDRLRELADINFETLQLMPMTPDQFGLALEIPYPVGPGAGAVLENASGADGAP
jgi:hypothetical protein